MFWLTADCLGQSALASELGAERLAWLTHSRGEFIRGGAGEVRLCAVGGSRGMVVRKEPAASHGLPFA